MFAAGLICAPGSFAHAESMIDAILAAYAQNPKINAERARQRGDQEKLPQARAGMFATINGSIEAGADRVSDTNTHKSNVGRSTVYGVTVSQPIFDGLRTYHDIKRAKAEIGAGRETLDAVSVDVFLSVVEAYVNVLRDRQIVDLRASAVNVFRNQVQQAQGRFKGGDLTRTGVSQSMVRLREAEGDHAQARADLAASEAYFRSVVGHHPGKLEKANVLPANLPRSLDQALRLAYGQNAKLRAAYYQFLAARFAVNSARGALVPTVSLEANSSRTDGTTGYDTQPNNSAVRLKLSMQLFNGGRDLSRVSQATATKYQRQMEVDDARATVRRLVEGAWYAIQGAEARAAASRQRIGAAQEALKGLLIEFNAGQTPIINVLDGRRELITAQVANAVAERDKVYHKVALMAAIGQLNLEQPGFATGVTQSVQAVAPPGKSVAHAPRQDDAPALQKVTKVTITPAALRSAPARANVAAAPVQANPTAAHHADANPRKDPWEGIARDVTPIATKDDSRAPSSPAKLSTAAR